MPSKPPDDTDQLARIRREELIVFLSVLPAYLRLTPTARDHLSSIADAIDDAIRNERPINGHLDRIASVLYEMT